MAVATPWFDAVKMIGSQRPSVIVSSSIRQNWTVGRYGPMVIEAKAGSQETVDVAQVSLSKCSCAFRQRSVDLRPLVV